MCYCHCLVPVMSMSCQYRGRCIFTTTGVIVSSLLPVLLSYHYRYIFVAMSYVADASLAILSLSVSLSRQYIAADLSLTVVDILFQYFYFCVDLLLLSRR